MVWRARQGEGPALTRAAIAEWIGANPGQGAMWIDQGTCARLLVNPQARWCGDAIEILAHQPPPAQIGEGESWAGWFSYDIAAAQVAVGVERTGALPGVGLARYPGALHLHTDGTYAVQGQTPWLSDLLNFAARPTPSPRWAYGQLRAQWCKHRYAMCFDAVQRHLQQGDTYQINLSHLFVAPTCARSTPSEALARAARSFAHLCAMNPAPYGVFVDVDGDRAILSNSPELLFSLEPQGRHWEICTGPIKGTRPRGDTPGADQRLAQALLSSEKDAAEHLMIVDLLRNDLVRVASAASVQAPPTPSLLTLPTVHHLETKIRAQLDPQRGMLDLWRALAPGGSVTGAPKRRSVEIIDALEAQARGIYCGSLFWADRAGMTANIAIRSAEARDGSLYLRSGGGIVLDSHVDTEWDETLDKTRAFAAPPCQKS